MPRIQWCLCSPGVLLSLLYLSLHLRFFSLAPMHAGWLHTPQLSQNLPVEARRISQCEQKQAWKMDSK